MRVYLPLTLPALRHAHETGEAGAAVAYAVTPELREWYGTENAEELEYAALEVAAQDSLRLLAADREAAGLRVVLAADVPDGVVATAKDGEPGAVRIDGPVRMSHVAAVHIDAEDAEPDIRAAAAALDEAARGDEEAASLADAAGDHELLWFATQEIPNLLP